MRAGLPSAEVLENIFHAALSAGDTQGVDAALRLLVVQDPRRAVKLYEETKTALKIAQMLGMDR